MVSKTEALCGRERIQQLVEAFPEVKRRQVVLLDLQREGVRPNETSRQLGRWALPDAPTTFDYNMEEARKAAERTEGYYLNPIAVYFGDGASTRNAFDSRSPYEFRYEERGRYRLYRDGEAIEEIFFPPRPQWYDRKTSSGKPMPTIIGQEREDSLKIAGMTYCEYFKDGKGCRYCNINPAQEVHKESGLTKQVNQRDQDLYETILAACRERTLRSTVITGGVILDTSKEADNYARIVRILRQAEKDAGYQTPMRVRVPCQAMEPENQMKLKEAGVNQLAHNIEVWDPKLFEWLCPGKAKYVGRERWIERLLHAVEIFGRGCVTTTFLQGLEMLEPYGFKNEDEGAESYLEGVEWMLAHGVALLGYPLRGAPRTEFAGRYSPRTEYHLRLQLARDKLCAKYNLDRIL